MATRELFIGADVIQVGVVEPDWQRVIKLAACPLKAKDFISTEYSQTVIDNTLNHSAYYIFDEGIATPYTRPKRDARRNYFSLVVLKKPIPLVDSEKTDIVIMFDAQDNNTHIKEGIRSIVMLPDNSSTMARLRTARSREEAVTLL